VVLTLTASGAISAPTTRISVATGGGQANGNSVSPEISGDGRFVAFYSTATNLVSGDTNRKRDVFVRDLQTGATTRVSVYNGGFEADGNSFHPTLSADGRLVAFESDSFNLAWNDPDEGFDIYIYDRQADVIASMSVDDAGNMGNDTSTWPSMTPDGRYVAYATDATDIVPDDLNGTRDIVLYDRLSGAANRLSLGNSGAEADGDGSHPSISDDSTLVAYESNASNLVPGDSNADRAGELPSRPGPQGPREVEAAGRTSDRAEPEARNAPRRRHAGQPGRGSPLADCC